MNVDKRGEFAHQHVRSGRIERPVGHQVDVNDETQILEVLGALRIEILVIVVVRKRLATLARSSFLFPIVRTKVSKAQVGGKDNRVVVNELGNLAWLSPALRSSRPEELRTFGDEVVVDSKSLGVWFGADENAENLGEVVPADSVSGRSIAGCRERSHTSGALRVFASLALCRCRMTLRRRCSGQLWTLWGFVVMRRGATWRLALGLKCVMLKYV